MPSTGQVTLCEHKFVEENRHLHRISTDIGEGASQASSLDHAAYGQFMKG